MSNEENKRIIKAIYHNLKSGNKAIWFLLTSMVGSTFLFMGLALKYVFYPLPDLPQKGSGIFRSADFNNPITIVGTETILYHLLAFICLILLWKMFVIEKYVFSRATKFLFLKDYEKLNAIN